MESRNTYRRLAQDCLKLSLSADTAAERTTLIDMAQAWLRLADSAPKLDRLVETALSDAKEALSAGEPGSQLARTPH